MLVEGWRVLGRVRLLRIGVEKVRRGLVVV